MTGEPEELVRDLLARDLPADATDETADLDAYVACARVLVDRGERRLAALVLGRVTYGRVATLGVGNAELARLMAPLVADGLVPGAGADEAWLWEAAASGEAAPIAAWALGMPDLDVPDVPRRLSRATFWLDVAARLGMETARARAADGLATLARACELADDGDGAAQASCARLRLLAPGDGRRRIE